MTLARQGRYFFVPLSISGGVAVVGEACGVTTVEDDGETGYIEWDVTDLVQAWVDETVTAKGFFLRPVGGGGTFKDIWTANTYAASGMLVSNTSTPGRVYAMSIEHHVRNEVRFDGVAN